MLVLQIRNNKRMWCVCCFPSMAPTLSRPCQQDCKTAWHRKKKINHLIDPPLSPTNVQLLIVIFYPPCDKNSIQSKTRDAPWSTYLIVRFAPSLATIVCHGIYITLSLSQSLYSTNVWFCSITGYHHLSWYLHNFTGHGIYIVGYGSRIPSSVLASTTHHQPLIQWSTSSQQYFYDSMINHHCNSHITTLATDNIQQHRTTQQPWIIRDIIRRGSYTWQPPIRL